VPRLTTDLLTVEWHDGQAVMVVGPAGDVSRDLQYRVVEELGRLLRCDGAGGEGARTEALFERVLLDGSGRSALVWRVVWPAGVSADALTELVVEVMGDGVTGALVYKEI
jgi:hypothetical protein